MPNEMTMIKLADTQPPDGGAECCPRRFCLFSSVIRVRLLGFMERLMVLTTTLSSDTSFELPDADGPHGARESSELRCIVVF
jgi:hypothetical protein